MEWFDVNDNDYLYTHIKTTYQYVPKQYMEHYIQIKTTILHHLAGPEADDIENVKTERVWKFLLHVDHLLLADDTTDTIP
eukprot:7384179-Prorocentrum_lima.AAC.1